MKQVAYRHLSGQALSEAAELCPQSADLPRGRWEALCLSFVQHPPQLFQPGLDEFACATEIVTPCCVQRFSTAQ